MLRRVLVADHGPAGLHRLDVVHVPDHNPLAAVVLHFLDHGFAEGFFSALHVLLFTYFFARHRVPPWCGRISRVLHVRAFCAN